MELCGGRFRRGQRSRRKLRCRGYSAVLCTCAGSLSWPASVVLGRVVSSRRRGRVVGLGRGSAGEVVAVLAVALGRRWAGRGRRLLVLRGVVRGCTWRRSLLVVVVGGIRSVVRASLLLLLLRWRREGREMVWVIGVGRRRVVMGIGGRGRWTTREVVGKECGDVHARCGRRRGGSCGGDDGGRERREWRGRVVDWIFPLVCMPLLDPFPTTPIQL